MASLCVCTCAHISTLVGGRGGETEPSGRGRWPEHGRELCIRQRSAHRLNWRDEDPTGQNSQLCRCFVDSSPEPSSFPGHLFRKRALLHHPIPGPKVLAPWGATQTNPPGQGPCWGSLCPAAPGLGTSFCLSVAQLVYLKKKMRPSQVGPSAPRQVPPQKSQTEQIKEKHKVIFKWHRGSRVVQVPPGAGGLVEKKVLHLEGV